MKHLLGAVLAASLVVAVTVPPGGNAAATPLPDLDRPNVVVILADDMRQDDLRYMRYTSRLLRSEGTTFQHVISPHPLCCPARASLVTGQYAQNNGVYHNQGQFGGWQSMEGDSSGLVPEWFHAAGYRTAFMGKFLNGYKGGELRGLTVNDASVRNAYNAYGITTWNNGEPVVREGHQTDWIAARTGELATQFSEEAPAHPFFLFASYVAPHSMTVNGRWRPTVPPARFTSYRKASHRVPQSFGKPSYNEADMRDKPRKMRRLRPVADSKIRRHHRGRVLALYGLDAAVRSTVSSLQEIGEWEDTVLVFTSDNGMGMGAHRLKGKNNPYQEALRVPFLMTGPGVPQGVRDPRVGTLVDLPATLAALTGVVPQRPQDGVNLFEAPTDRAVLIQAGGFKQPFTWRGVYTRRHTYVRREASGEIELYDRRRDPHELQNLARSRRHGSVRRALQRLYRDQLRDCVGDGCQAAAPR